MRQKHPVYLVGAGPGDPGLLTCRGLQCIQRADILVYDGLVAIELLGEASRECELYYAGKKHSNHAPPLTQEEINTLLVQQAQAGKVVVRLKGGDPFVFGRGSEECQALRAANIDFEVVPGVSSATAVAAYAGIPLTARRVSATAVLVTGHQAPDKPKSDVDWAAVAGNQTIVLFMAWKKIRECVDHLLAAGRDPQTPAAAIRWGTTAQQQTCQTTLSELPNVISQQQIKPPVLIVIGDVVKLREELNWYEQRPLFGRRILLTRSPQAAAFLASQLRDLGAQVLVVPTTEITAVGPSETRALHRALGAMDGFDWVFFTSANAVQSCWQALDSLQLDARIFAGTQIAAVGQATNAALGKRGLRADVCGTSGGGQLARQLVKTAGTTQRILYPRAATAHPEPIEVLRRGGCVVTDIPVYRSQTVQLGHPILTDALAQLTSGSLDAAVFFAPSQIEALIALCPGAPAALAKLDVLGAIGSTTASALTALALRPNAIPKTPSTADLLATLVEQLVDKK